MSQMRSILVSILAVLMVFAPFDAAFAQPTTVTTTVALSTSVGESLTVSATPSSMILPTSPGVYSSPIAINTTWNLANSYTLQVDTGFASATAALVNGSTNVPSSSIFNQFSTSVSGAVVTGGGGGPCNQSLGANAQGIAANGGCAAWTKSGVTGQGSDSTTTIALNASLGSSPAAGNYSGTLQISFSAH